MRRGVEFGIRLPVAGAFADAGNLRSTATFAEKLGYDALWVHDHLIWTRDLDRGHVSCGSVESVVDGQPPMFFESVTTQSYVAGLTSSIRIGFSVLILAYREPVSIAKQLATLDVLSNGRVILGLGVGAAKKTGNVDFEVLGIDRKTKYELWLESIEAIQTIWAEDSASYHGRFVNFENAVVYPKPLQKPAPPIWIAGVGPRSMDLVARFANGWLPSWQTPAGYREKLVELDALLEGYGRTRRDVQIGTEIVLCLGKDDKDARERSQRTVQTFTKGFTTRSEEEAAAASLIGGTEEVMERVSALADAGVQHFELKPIYHSIGDLHEQMERFSTEIISKL